MQFKTLLSLAGLAGVLAASPLAAQYPAVPPTTRDTGALANDSTRDRGPSVIPCDTTMITTAPADTSATIKNRLPVPQCANGIADTSVAGAVKDSVHPSTTTVPSNLAPSTSPPENPRE